MDLDSGLIEYMKKRADYAKLVATVLSVQCFLLAVFFCEYGLWVRRFAFSNSMEGFRLFVIWSSAGLSIIMAIFAFLVSIKYKSVYSCRPDFIAIRQSSDTCKEAYKIARPVLIYKITTGILLMVLSGLVYIILRIVLDRSEISGVYGRVEVAILLGVSILLIVPAIDRMRAYRVMLNEVHDLGVSPYKCELFLKTVSILMPMSIGTWYILRFYTDKMATGWIVFPMTALFGLAIIYLVSWVKES